MSVVSPSGLYRKDKPVTDWPSIRRWVLNRDRQLCQICLVREATDVDHIWPRRLGGPDHIDNLRAACGPCNKMKSARVNFDDASDEQLLLGMDALTMRIAELEVERGDIRRTLDLRMLSGHSASAITDRIEAREAVELHRARLRYERAARMHRNTVRAEQAHLPDAQIYDFPETRSAPGIA